MRNQLSRISSSAAAKALRRLRVSLGRFLVALRAWAAIAATALDHGVPA
jgi:hypothetical protein